MSTRAGFLSNFSGEYLYVQNHDRCIPDRNLADGFRLRHAWHLGLQRCQWLKKTLLHTESNLRHWLAGGFFYPDFYPDYFQER